MNEIGLDPGIDHLYAVKTIEEVHREGGKITSFLSYCGGLPAPENSGNPLGYKFSWSPRGVLLALRNPASFYQDGEVVNVEGPDLMATAKPYHIYPGFALVAYPNRDSTGYKERYNIPEAQTIIRYTCQIGCLWQYSLLTCIQRYSEIQGLPGICQGSCRYRFPQRRGTRLLQGLNPLEGGHAEDPCCSIIR